MEAYPTDRSMLDRLLERTGRGGCPIIGRIVELNKKLVLRKKRIVDELGVFNVIHSEVVSLCLFLQPYLRGVDEGFVNAASFSDSNNFEWRGNSLCHQVVRKEQG